MDKFDEALFSAIDSILGYAPGGACIQTICHYSECTS